MAMPVLADSFFTELRPGPEFFKKWKTEGPWGPSLMPIYFWDGLLFVAATGAAGFSTQAHWRVVKADAEKMRALWEELSAPSMPSDPPPPPPPEFEEKTPPPVHKKSAASPPPPPTTAASTTNSSETDLSAIWRQLEAAGGPGMILLVHGNDAFPWKWDPRLEGGTIGALSLGEPSPFRIAFRTQKSFHGPVAPNAPTTQFFANWNQGTVPENLTVSPVMHKERLAGLLVTWGSAAANTKETLVTVEATAQDLARLFESQPSLLRAA